MKATLIPQEVPEITHAIMVGDKQVGDVRKRDRGYYHAALEVRPSDSLHTSGLAQGFGSSPEEAIANAFERSAQQIDEFQASLASLRQQVLG